MQTGCLLENKSIFSATGCKESPTAQIRISASPEFDEAQAHWYPDSLDVPSQEMLRTAFPARTSSCFQPWAGHTAPEHFSGFALWNSPLTLKCKVEALVWKLNSKDVCAVQVRSKHRQKRAACTQLKPRPFFYLHFYLGSCVTCTLLLFQQDTGTETCHKNWVVWRVSPNPLTPIFVFTSGSQNTSLQRGRKDDLAHQILPQACQSCILQVPLPAPVKTSAPLLGYSWHHHSKSWISSKECSPRYFFWDILCLKIKKPTHTQIRCNHTHVLFLVLRKAHLQWGHPQTEIRVICLAGFPGGIHNKKDTASVLKISVYIHHASSSDFKL